MIFIYTIFISPKNSDRIISLWIYSPLGEPVGFVAISSEKARLLRSARNDNGNGFEGLSPSQRTRHDGEA